MYLFFDSKDDSFFAHFCLKADVYLDEKGNGQIRAVQASVERIA